MTGVQCRLPSPGIPCERRCAGTPFNSPSERGRKRITLCEGDGRPGHPCAPFTLTLGPPLNLPLRGGGKDVRERGHDRRSGHHPPLWIPAFAGMTFMCGRDDGGAGMTELLLELAAFYEVVEEVGVGF